MHKRIVDQNGHSYSRGLLMAVMLFGAFFPILNETVLATAYPKLMTYFNINTSTVQWLTSAFLMVVGIMIPISAWLMERINTKTLFISTLVIFEIGTILAWHAPNFGTLLAARIIQAMATGVLMPLFQTVIFNIYPKGERGVAMGLGGLVMGLAPAIGPTLSGWIIDNARWQDLFSINTAPIAAAIICAIFLFKPVLPVHKAKIDYLSVVFSTVGFGSMLYGFSSVGQNGRGSPVVLTTLLVGIIFTILFVWRDLKTKYPLVDLSVFRSFKFDLGTAIASLAMMGLVGFEMILPLYLQTVRGDNAFHSGLTLLAGALTIGLISPVTGKIFDKYGARYLCISGFFLMGVGTLPFIFLTKDTPVLYLVVLYAVRSVGIAMSLMTITTYSLNDLPTSNVNNGSSALNTVRQIASSIATAVLTSVLSNVTKNATPSKHLLTTDPLRYKSSMIHAALSGYHAAFIIALAFCVIGFIATFWVRNKKEVA